MKFNIIPFEGTNIIKLGMTSEEIQYMLNLKPQLYKKTEFDLYETEDYKNICHVYYELGLNGLLICAAIEFFKPSEIYIDGIQIIGQPRDDVQNLFMNKFSDIISDSSGFHSGKNDISVFAPILPDKKVVESVYIARKGYSVSQKYFYQKAFAEKYLK